MIKRVLWWGTDWTGGSTISFIDNWGEHTEHREAYHIPWMETVPLLSAGFPHYSPRYSSRNEWPKKRASGWSVRMIHCQFTGLYIKLHSGLWRGDGPCLLSLLIIYILTHTMVLHWFGATVLKWLLSKHLNLNDVCVSRWLQGRPFTAGSVETDITIW